MGKQMGNHYNIPETNGQLLHYMGNEWTIITLCMTQMGNLFAGNHYDTRATNWQLLQKVVNKQANVML